MHERFEHFAATMPAAEHKALRVGLPALIKAAQTPTRTFGYVPTGADAQWPPAFRVARRIA